jgi:hypothetical protein
MGIGWFIAMVWAYYKPDAENPGLEQRVQDLESKIADLQAKGGES